MFTEQIEKSKKENDVKNIMENNIIALRKIKKLQKSITTIKEMNNNLINLSSKEKKYLISSFSLKLSFEFIDYWNKNQNKKNLFIKCLKDEKREIQSKYLIDKINLIKFILLQFHQIINDDMNNNNFECTKYIFDNIIINQLIFILYEYTINSINSKIIEYEDEEIIIFNICRILIKLTNLSSYFSFLILQNDMNLQLIFSSMKDFFKKNQCISCNLLLLIYNLYADDEDTILLKCDKLIPFILEALYNYQINPKENIILPNFLFNLLEFLTKLLNEKTFNKFFNDKKINNCILLTINIYKNYDDISIKKSSLKCLLCLFHCINGDYEIKIDKKSFIKTFLPNLNIELNSPYLVINILEIISYMSFLYEIDDFSTDELIDEINQILISFVFHKEQIKMNYDKNEINIIIENISVILLNFCLSSKVAEYMTKNTTIMKNIILILNNYSLDTNIIQNLYNFIKDFMDNIDNFVHLIICNYLEIGIIKNLEKYLFNKKYEIILIILNHTYKSLEFGNINQNNLNINFVQSYLDKKGFNDILNIIISPDFGNLECSSLAKAIQQDYFK